MDNNRWRISINLNKMDYTFNEDKWYALYHITTGALILKDKLDAGYVLSTIHTVVWITEQEFLEWE